MRRKYLIFSILGLLFSAGFFYLGSSDVPEPQRDIDRTLQLQARDFAGALNDRLGSIEKSVIDSFRSRKITSDEVGAIYDRSNKKLIKPEVFPPGLKRALVEHARGRVMLKLWRLGKHNFVLWKTEIDGNEIVAAVQAEKMFAPFRTGKFTQPFVANEEGQVIFYSKQRFVGSASKNIRPISLAQASLAKSERIEKISTYLGIDGTDVKGAWITLPRWQLVVGLEWPDSWWSMGGMSPYSMAALVLAMLAALFVGLSITPQPILVQAVKRQVKDLDPESRSIIEKAINSARSAHDYVARRDKELDTQQEKAGKEMARAKRMQWELQNLEDFLDDLSELKSSRSVWVLLAEKISQMSLNAPVVVFHYSPASFTLMPAATANLEIFDKAAQAYLRDARILLGDIRLMHQLTETKAMQNWEQKREKYMADNEHQLIWVPFFSRFGTAGAVGIFVNDEMNFGQTLAKQTEYWQMFADRAAWMYDLMKPSVKQRMYVASSSNQTASVSENSPRG